MNKQDFQAKGGLISNPLVKKSITWLHPETGEEMTGECFVVKHGYGGFKKLVSVDKDTDQSALYVSTSIRIGENGEESFTYEEALTAIERNLFFAFLKAANEVNGTGSEAKN